MTNFQELKKEDVNLLYDDAGYLTVGPNNQFKLTLGTEYYFTLFKKVTGFLGLAPELIFARKIYGFSTTLSYPDENGIRRGYTSEDDYNKNVFIGVNLSFGINLKTKPLLLQPFITYHYQPENLFTSVVTTQNLLVSENTVSEHHITGNYLMFGLKVIPSRNLFSSKK